MCIHIVTLNPGIYIVGTVKQNASGCMELIDCGTSTDPRGTHPWSRNIRPGGKQIESVRSKNRGAGDIYICIYICTDVSK